jgi:hypothetical protein
MTTQPNGQAAPRRFPMKKHPVLDALQKASEGLVFTSETDAKLEPFLWQDGGDMTKANVL